MGIVALRRMGKRGMAWCGAVCVVGEDERW
jgi:hypothetical protein